MTAIETELPTVSSAPSADAIPLNLRRRGGSPRQVLAVTLVGTLVLAMFASRDLNSWTERLGDGPLAQTVQSLAAEWDGGLDRLSLTRPHEALRLTIRRLLDLEWPTDRS